MVLRLFDTRLRQKISFQPIHDGYVGMYVCGVTVYDMSHIGHARVMVAFDVIYRFLKSIGYNVKYVRNFTDVDDKIIKRANERGVTCETLTNQYIQEFYQDFDALGCLRPDIEPRVSTHMAEIVDLIGKIVERGHGYEAGGDVYFDIASYGDYGKLSGRSVDDMQAGASERVSADELGKKRHPLDFVLWKASKPGEPTWNSPWGPGRPGWHIECSAMAAAHLGVTFDLHGGGKDLVFPHHENEIAQSECGFGAEFARHWVHNGFVNVDDEKMSKSLGNMFTVRDVLEKYHPQVIRCFLLSTHYRSPINYSDRNLDDALRRVMYVYETLQKIDEILSLADTEAASDGASVHEPELVFGTWPKVVDAMLDDFNTAAAMGALSDLIRYANDLAAKSRKKAPLLIPTLRAVRDTLTKASAVFGVFDLPPTSALEEIQALLVKQMELDVSVVEDAVARRTRARDERNWAEADRIRNELLARNVCIMDTPSGTTWKVVPRGGAEDCAV